MKKNGRLSSRIVLVCAVWLLPYGAFASVSISEVAWMGSQTSANHEWIELYNDGAAVSVDGWVLDDGMNLQIELVGTIPAQSYVVLERTSDASAPGSAFLIYTGALVNTGATLKLRDATGALVDQVSGGEDWKHIGGDNITKETAQYSPKGWVTAQATAGGPPPADVPKKELENDDETKDVSVLKKTSSNKSETIQLELPEVSLQLSIDTLKTGYVHQPITFFAEPSGVGKTFIDSLTYEWNFGDGFVGSGKEIKHVFQYPGTYVVTVYGEFKRQKQVTRHEITILPVNLSLTTNTTGDIQLNNDSPYELDISGYRMKGTKEFTFPQYSIILPNQTVTIPRAHVVETSEAMVAVYDTEDALVASRMPRKVPADATPKPVITQAPLPKISAISDMRSTHLPDSAFTFANKDNEQTNEIVKVDTEVVTQPAQIAAVTGSQSDTNWSMVAFSSLLLVGVAGVLLTPRRNKNVGQILPKDRTKPDTHSR